jgi:hypothetical protein
MDVGTPADPRGRTSLMNKTPSTSSESGRLHGGIAPLAVVIATKLANAHSTDQYLAGLAALAFVLAHDTIVHRR